MRSQTYIFEISIFKILTPNSNVKYNTGQQTVAEKKNLCKLNVAQRLPSFNLCSSTTPSSRTSSMLSVSVLGPHNTPANINSSLSWLHTFTLCITRHSRRALSFQCMVPCETICTLISRPSTFYILTRQLENKFLEDRSRTPQFPHNIFQSIFTNRHLLI